MPYVVEVHEHQGDAGGQGDVLGRREPQTFASEAAAWAFVDETLKLPHGDVYASPKPGDRFARVVEIP